MSRRTNLLWVSAFLSLIFVLPQLNEIVRPLQAPSPKSYLTSELAQKRPLILCHRGSRYMGPENTIHMHTWALQAGCDVLEMDVRLTKDNELVVFHDDYVDRVCNARGPVRDFTLKEIRDMDCGYHFSPERQEYQHAKGHTDYDEAKESKISHPFRGTGLGRVPLFSEFMEAFPTTFKNVEIKENENSVADLVIAELQRVNPAAPFDNVVISSRWCEVLQYIREKTQHKVATGACEREGILFFLLSKLKLSNLYFSLIQPQNQVYQMPTVSSGVTVLNKNTVNAAHATGQKAQYWVVNDPAEVAEVLVSGADGLVSDRCDLAHRVLYEQGLVPTDLTTQIDRSLINTTRAFFIPQASANEVHVCVSAMCTVLPFIMNNSQVLMAAFVSILVVLVFIMSSAEAPTKNVAAAGGKKKKAE